MKSTLLRVRNTVLHVLFLIILFIAAMMFFSRMINRTESEDAGEMAQSSFPLIYMQRDNTNFNCLHGYARQMDPSYMNGTVTPLEEDRSIGIAIETFSASIDGISYEVITSDGREILENTQVVKTDKDADTVKAVLKLQDKMRMNTVYVLQICLNSGGRDIYYYTHVYLADGLHTDDYLNFVSGFYEKTVNRTDLTSVGAAVEPDDTTDAEQTLAYMDIHDSVNQLCWGNLKPQIYYKPTPQITEINESTASIVNDYRIAAVSEDGKTEIYNVHEFYRLRYTDSRVFLLNFDRTTGQVFDPDNDVLDNGKGVMLGVADKNIEFAYDEKQREFAFVQENALWTYEPSSGRMTKVFSFPQSENMDYRDFYDASDIHILNVSTAGDVWFTVSGYMNRGEHEGENGVALYYFDAATNQVQEKTFLSSMENYELLSRDTWMETYISENRRYFYVLLEENLYRIDLETQHEEVVAGKIKEHCCAGSRSGRYFAYLPEGLQYGSSALVQLDLETGSQTEFKAGSGEKISPQCYMGENLVYGLAKDEDIALGTLRDGRFPMYSLRIADGEGSELKNYTPDGVYIMKIEQSENMLNLVRMKKSGDTFEETVSDQIVSTDTASSVSAGAATQETDRRENVVILRVGTSASDTVPDVVTSRISMLDSSRNVEIPVNTERQTLYSVYSGGKLYNRTAYINEAITEADAQRSYVMDNAQNYVWVRGDKDTSSNVKISQIPEAMVNGTTPEDLADALDSNALDLTECTLDEVLYFVSHGKAVLALGDKGYTTIVGFDEYNTHLLDPNTDEWYYYGINDSTAMFEKHGNVFYTYE